MTVDVDVIRVCAYCVCTFLERLIFKSASVQSELPKNVWTKGERAKGANVFQLSMGPS